MIQLRSVSLLALVALAAAASAQEVYMQGLSGPRSLYFDTDGTLLVTESGTGGGAPSAGGLNGGVSGRKGNAAQTKVLDNLPSITAPDGQGAVGPADVMRTADGKLAVLFGLGGAPTLRTGLGADYAKAGTLSFYDQSTGTWTPGEDYAAREAAEGAGDGEINSNPFSFVQDGAGYAVVDSGANRVWRDGSSTLFIPQDVPNPFGGPGTFPMDAVPTSILARPGGGFLVSELGGFPFVPGLSRLYTLDANGNIIDTKNGFTAVLDMAYAPDGSLLVAQYVDKGLNQTGGFDPTGSIVRIRPDGTKETLIPGLITPTSIAFGPDGMLYVASTDFALGGIVTRFAYQPVPEPATLAALGLGAVAMLRRRKRA